MKFEKIGGVWEWKFVYQRYATVLCMLLKSRVTQRILWAVHCLCRMCRRVLLVVHWLHIGTRLPFLDRCRTYCSSFVALSVSIMTLHLMVWDWRILRAESMLLVLLIFLFLSPNTFYFSNFRWLVVWGWGLLIYSVLTVSQSCTAGRLIFQ